MTVPHPCQGLARSLIECSRQLTSGIYLAIPLPSSWPISCTTARPVPISPPGTRPCLSSGRVNIITNYQTSDLIYPYSLVFPVFSSAPKRVFHARVQWRHGGLVLSIGHLVDLTAARVRDRAWCQNIDSSLGMGRANHDIFDIGADPYRAHCRVPILGALRAPPPWSSAVGGAHSS